MKRDMDEVLKQALTPTEEPNFWLNQNILNQVKETSRMDNRTLRKRIPAAVLAAAVVVGAGSVSAYAAWKYLAPEEVTEHVNDQKLADAFQGEDAVLMNERQSGGGYEVTLLGIVSGKDLSEYESFHNGALNEDRTYIVSAIENADGTPMPETMDEAYDELSFFVSPLIKGYKPWLYNAASMRGVFQEFTKDGVLYRLTECDNVEIFADHGLYLCVLDQTFYDTQAYDYNETTGEITRNEGYQGLNALFELPVDASKADPKAAAEYLTSLEDEEEDEAGQEETEDDAKVTEWMQQVTPENIDEYAQRLEDTVQVLQPDENGEIHYSYDVEEHSSCSGVLPIDHIFPDRKLGMAPDFAYNSDGTLEGLLIETFTLNEDGTVTFAAYIPKNTQG